jgi:hypothetical protein
VLISKGEMQHKEDHRHGMLYLPYRLQQRRNGAETGKKLRNIGRTLEMLKDEQRSNSGTWKNGSSDMRESDVDDRW